jgi:hypothetical protein
MFERAIVGFFRVLGKTAPGELSHFQMIRNALATGPFSGAWFIGAVTFFKVLFPITFHGFPPRMLNHRQRERATNLPRKLTDGIFLKNYIRCYYILARRYRQFFLDKVNHFLNISAIRSVDGTLHKETRGKISDEQEW